jgi:Tfp pilus assembly protein PilF
MNTDTSKMPLRMHGVLYVLLLPLLALAGCSLPKIIVLNDPLSAEEHLKLGSIYHSQGKTALARDQFREAARRDPKSLRAWSLLGDAASKMKEYAEAEKAYRKAMDLDEKNGDLRNNLAWIYVEQGKGLEDAQALAKKAMELTPEHRPFYLDTLGMALLKQGKHGEAVAALKESTETIPKEQPAFLAEAYGHLADAYHAAGDEAAAQEAAQARDRLVEKK